MTTSTEKRSSHSDFEELWADAEKSDSYWVTLASMQFASSIRSHLRRTDMTQVGLAERLGWKPAQLSRALRGHQNLTVRSMVEICRSLGLRLELSALPVEGARLRTDRALRDDRLPPVSFADLHSELSLGLREVGGEIAEPVVPVPAPAAKPSGATVRRNRAKVSRVRKPSKRKR